MSSTDILPALSKIVCDTQQFSQNATIPHRRSPTRRPLQLCLPDPPSLYPSLVAIGAGEKIANEMNRAYNARALELRTYYEKSISNAFAALSNFPLPRDLEKRILDTFASFYLTKVKSWIDDGVAAYKSNRKSTKQVTNDEVSRGANSRRNFNPDYIPLLEHFFDENPFPTQADKILLAKKSNMTYRQIHVWFQNRRNRTKKSNAPGRKGSTCEFSTLPRNTPGECVGKHTMRSAKASCTSFKPHFLTYTVERRSIREGSSPSTAPHSMSPQRDDSNILDKCVAPLHAFPSPYPPACHSDAFSRKSRSQPFSDLKWERGSSRSTSLRSSESDINDLVDRFTLLSVRDIHSRRSQGNCGVISDSPAATCAITVTPSPAPHPALIKPAKFVPLVSRRSPFPIVRASQPTLEAFSDSSASTLTASFTKDDTVSRRRVSPLPRRHLSTFTSIS